jgi:hypothetical protein
MSQLRTHLEEYINDLKSLLKEYSDSRDLIDAAEKKWGDEDSRYMLLTEKPKMRFGEPSADVTNEDSPSDDEEPNELIDWLPSYLNNMEDILSKSTDDQALLSKAEEKFRSVDSYGYRVVSRK